MAAPALAAGEESPGSMETRCRVTPGGGDPRESATESKPPAGTCSFGTYLRVRVKGCGKSAPRRRQRRRHGKPHREQDQVGATASASARMLRAGLFPGRSPGSVARDSWRHGSQRNGHPPALGAGTEPGLQAACASSRPRDGYGARPELSHVTCRPAAALSSTRATYPQNCAGPAFS